ncbi:MAG: hypothetical protein BA863_05580 [Desulfovibrio sp. S3730MH75]|nr:MAG: hypothetical protein BA863_05580 [Desulfovibrio sp. S3730MH75]
MENREFDTKSEAKLNLSRRAVELQKDEPEAQDTFLSLHDPLKQVVCRIGDASCADAHASTLDRTTDFKPDLSKNSLLQLQKQYGNRYVQHVLALAGKAEGTNKAETSIRWPLNVEQELNRKEKLWLQPTEEISVHTKPVFRQVVAGIPKCTQSKGSLQHISNTNSQSIHRNTIQGFEAAAKMPSMSLASTFRTVIQNEGAGQKLNQNTREFMETRFGHDFSSVRLHKDSRSAHLSRLIDADAFTIGGHIFWGSPDVDTNTPKGQRLLAHELVHVLQQRQAGIESTMAMNYEFVDGGVSEQEADRIADDVSRDYKDIRNDLYPGTNASRTIIRPAPIKVRPVSTTVQTRRRPGESFTGCVNNCLSSQGIAGAITTMIWVGCGIIGGIGALGGSLLGPGGTLTGLGIALALCLAFGTGFPVGVISGCLTNCAD